MTDYSVYENQLHQFYSFSTFTSGMNYVNVNMPSFAVKEIKFDFAYNFKSAGFSTILVTADIANSEMVGMMNTLSYTYNDGKDVNVYNDGFSASKAISFIPRKPIRPNGSIGFNFLNLVSGSTITNFTCTIHVEFLGY